MNDYGGKLAVGEGWGEGCWREEQELLTDSPMAKAHSCTCVLVDTVDEVMGSGRL